MRPYAAALGSALLGFTLLIPFARASAVPAKKKAKPPEAAAANRAPLLGRRLSTEDPHTRSGLNHLYNLEYDKAIADFEETRKLYPADPFALNHLLQAILLKELYRLNALDTTLYADNGFLTGKPLAGYVKVKQQILDLSEEGLALSNEVLKREPENVQMLYARGVTRGLRLTHAAIIEKSFFSALKNASASRSDHERVLQLDPAYTDAKLLVGVHNFVIGSLSLAGRVMAGVIGMSGSKKRGIEYLYEVGRSKGETNVDARVALSLFLRREAKYEEALEVSRTLTAEYPHNFIFALEEAN